MRSVTSLWTAFASAPGSNLTTPTDGSGGIPRRSAASFETVMPGEEHRVAVLAEDLERPAVPVGWW